jgi:hypothetical protein
LRAHQIIRGRPRVLELGCSNWYGDVPLEDFEQEIRRLVTDPAERDRQVFRLSHAVAARRPDQLYEIANIFYDSIVQAGAYSAVDPGSPGSRFQFDLNLPVPIEEKFDLTINIGTAEHIFNVFQFFKTAHDRTETGGLMMHSSPFTGWPDHGFYNFQPTFFFDLARANQYEILSFVCGRVKPFEYVQVRDHDHVPQLIRAGKIPASSHINVVFRKNIDADFAAPMQAYYAGVLSKETARSWHEMR